MKTGIELIVKERNRQIKSEKWDSDHDDQHDEGELAQAAMVYCKVNPSASFIDKYWPFDAGWYKPNPVVGEKKGRVRELVKAGALIAAEIDRIQRLKK